MDERGYRPDLQSQRRRVMWLLLSSVPTGVFCIAASRSVPDARILLFLGILQLICAVITVPFVMFYLYPRGFTLPDGIDPTDRTAVRTAIKRYRRARRHR